MSTPTRYQVLHNEGGVPVKAWTVGVPFEQEAVDQLRRVAALPFVYKWVAAMPDVHAGMGATIGSVIATDGAVIPAAVGVDIGCGMVAAQTSLARSDLPSDLGPLRASIEAAVPHGRSDNGGPGDVGAWQQPPEPVRLAWDKLAPGYDEIVRKAPRIDRGPSYQHLGTLGTGNHFIELCADEQDRIWLLLHSGSRGVGNRIGSHYINAAKQEMNRWFIRLQDPALAYLAEDTAAFDDYLHAAQWAQEYAKANRQLMLDAVIQALRSTTGLPSFRLAGDPINCHHNYVARERHYGKNVWVTRKGAVRARSDDYGIIPGSMGARSYIVRGREDPESFHSCSHGAGRAMSRTAARKAFSLQDHAAATAGIECRKDEDVLDETPAAYKPIDAVMEAQKDLVEPLHTLRQLVCVKG